ncbi:MAG: tetratricopeptide repeat protein [Rhodospirillaceae bacterium]
MLSWFKRRSQPPITPDKTTAVPVSGDEAKRAVETALACCARGQYAEAESLARQAIELQYDCADAHLLLAQLCHRRYAYEEAADGYLLASCFAPSNSEPRLHLGLLYLDQHDFVQAEEVLRGALEQAPENARLHNALGAVLLNIDRLDEARQHFEQAVALDPFLAGAHSNLGYLLFRDFEQFAKGEAHVRQALELAPDDLNALTNLTMVLRDRPHEVIEIADRLLARDPTLDAVRLNRAFALLTLGEFERGWRDYEARKSTRCNYIQRAMPWPEWDGSELTGRGIYIHSEQGLGDEIMFASCLPQIIAAAGRCVVECSPKLKKTFERSFGVRVVVKPDDDTHVAQIAGEGIDCYSALGSLPRFLRSSPDDFPKHAGYLKADETRVAYWRDRLSRLPGKLKIGIAWRGGVPSTQRSVRSTDLEQWLPLLRMPNIDFVDLQHFESPEEVGRLQAKYGVAVHRWPDAHEDYDETAALVAALDMVISVQTAIVHLSGALGKEVWALIPESPEWRYLSVGVRMPWYPSVRLFRKARGSSWESVIADVAGAFSVHAPHGPVNP